MPNTAVTRAELEKKRREIIRWIYAVGLAVALLYGVVCTLMVVGYIHNRDYSRKNRSTLDLVCDRTYNLIPITEDFIVVMEERIVADQDEAFRKKDYKRVGEDAVAIGKLLELKVRTSDQLVRPKSLCQKVP
jgi:hypothetical protein